MNGVVPAPPQPRDPGAAAILTVARAAVGSVAAVVLAVVGLRLGLDAEDLADRMAFARPEFAVPTVRWAGVSALAAAQAVGVAAVVWAGHRRRRGDALFAGAAAAVAVLAGFAATVMAVSGR